MQLKVIQWSESKNHLFGPHLCIFFLTFAYVDSFIEHVSIIWTMLCPSVSQHKLYCEGRHGISVKLYTILKFKQFFYTKIRNFFSLLRHKLRNYFLLSRQVCKQGNIFIDSPLQNVTFLHTNSINFACLVNLDIN